ncbi:MAG: AAA family ATPase [Saccharofermentanales bacterium]
MADNDFNDWVEFYTKFAIKLLTFKHDRKALIKKLITVFQITGLKLPKLEHDGKVIDIDPFTVFGLFNKGITEGNRIRLIKGMAFEFSIEAKIPVSFTGIPVLNNLNATFYRFGDDRGPDDIDNLWNLFETAINYADYNSNKNRQFFIKAFDSVKDLKGNRWKLTMGLFWIRPYNYINLDSRNRWFINNRARISADCISLVEELNTIPDAKTYLDICEQFKKAFTEGKYEYADFIEFSHSAWKISEEVNQETKNPAGSRGNTGAAIADENTDVTHYWIYSPGDSAEMWDEFYPKGIMAIGWDAIGDLRQYASKTAMRNKMNECIDENRSFKNAAHATWQFVNEMKPGDIVFAKKGMYQLLGRGVVASDYKFNAKRPDKYKNIRDVEWTHNGVWQHPGQAAQKTLTDITAYTDYVKKLNALFKEDLPDDDSKDILYPPYSVEDFLDEAYMDEDDYLNLVSLILNKKNIILQGAPGVGKTYVAKRLAYSIMGEKNRERVMMVQFHQSYSYEDFIMGFRPSENGFELRKGAFYNFCKNAEIDNENEYFFIIDEINRGNLSKIFGELFMLIENDKRGIELQLLYSDEKFAVPDNVYIIGMMNTADRSLAMLDYALRRRFAFFDIKPGFKSEGFIAYGTALGNKKFDRLVICVENLNDAISADESLGKGFRIGHSYFCNFNNIDDQTLNNVIEYELIPLLKEYWFDEPAKVKDWSSNLRSAIK